MSSDKFWHGSDHYVNDLSANHINSKVGINHFVLCLNKNYINYYVLNYLSIRSHLNYVDDIDMTSAWRYFFEICQLNISCLL